MSNPNEVPFTKPTLTDYVRRVVFFGIGIFWACLTLPPQLLMILFGGFKALKKKSYTEEPAKLNQIGEHGFVDVGDGVKLHYVTKGSGPLMIMLHGFPELWYSWRYQIEEFSKDHKVVALDMRGYGRSSRPAEKSSYNIQFLTRDFSRVVEHFKVKKCILVAHDWGGVVAWQAAHRYHDQIEKLVIMNCPHPVNFEKKATLKQFLKSWYIFLFQLPMIPEFYLSLNDFAFIGASFRGKKMGCRNRDNISPEDVEVFKYSIAQPGALTAAINYYRNLWHPPHFIPKKTLDFPVLIVWGEKDGALEKSLVPGTEKFAPKLTVKYIENASHWVNQDSPQEVNAFMREFLKQ